MKVNVSVVIDRRDNARGGGAGSSLSVKQKHLMNEDGFRPASEILDSIVGMLGVRDEGTCRHSRETAAWCRFIAGALNVPEAQTEFIVKAGILHDVGKLGIPDTILFKPGPLSETEWGVMRRHAEVGARILADLPALARYASIVHAHHERWDGTGYPRGLKGRQIPFAARIVGVADSFHALISDRPYRPAVTQSDALAIMREGRGTQWDAGVVDALIMLLHARKDFTRLEALRA